MLKLTRILEIVPFVRGEYSLVYLCKSENKMCANMGINVCREELPLVAPVLTPVGVVADSFIAVGVIYR